MNKQTIYENKKQGDMGDSIGNMPKIKDKAHALKEIIFVANDKRGHFTLDDSYDWLNLKMKLIKKLAKLGLKTNS